MSLQLLTAGAVPLGSVLWTSVGVSPGLFCPVISLMGCILPGCCRVLPSAGLFSGSWEFSHECGLLFFSMGIHTFLFSSVFDCPCTCRESFQNFMCFFHNIFYSFRCQKTIETALHLFIQEFSHLLRVPVYNCPQPEGLADQLSSSD